jgi:hypothetical protein
MCKRRNIEDDIKSASLILLGIGVQAGTVHFALISISKTVGADLMTLQDPYEGSLILGPDNTVEIWVWCMPLLYQNQVEATVNHRGHHRLATPMH